MESEGSLRQNAGLMNKNQIRQTYRVSVPMNTKPNTYTECMSVDLAGISRKVKQLTRGGLKASCDPQASIDEVSDEQSA